MNADERLLNYRLSGWREEAKKDPNWKVRREAYKVLGWTEEEKKDENWLLKLEAYRSLVFN